MQPLQRAHVRARARARFTSRCHHGCLAGSSMLPFPLIINLLVVSSICVVHFSLFVTSTNLAVSTRPVCLALPYPAPQVALTLVLSLAFK